MYSEMNVKPVDPKEIQDIHDEQKDEDIALVIKRANKDIEDASHENIQTVADETENILNVIGQAEIDGKAE